MELYLNMPEEVRTDLLIKYLHKVFLLTFRDFFMVKRPTGTREFYTWNNQDYRSFMVEVFKCIEPWRCENRHQILEEHEEA